MAELHLITREEFEPVLKELAALRQELTVTRRLVIENGERISTKEIRKLTGITDIRTLQKRFNWQQKGTGPITWSKSEVLQWLAENELKKAS